MGQLPHQGRVVPGEGRRLLTIPDIQYVIDYRIDEVAIRILRIWHTAQDQTP